jgi:nucleolar protein 9
VRKLVVPFVQAADEDDLTPLASTSSSGNKKADVPVLLDHRTPHELRDLLGLQVSEDAQGKDGLLEMISTILKYSVNTWSQGFLDKLYASPSAVGVVAELLLAVLNTNVHVYQVSPVLTLIEKFVTAELAKVFGYTSEHAGGISQPGGSASNGTSITIARNTLHPETKTEGLGGKRLIMFTSQHGHYSLEKAAQIQGFGSKAVRGVAVDDQGRMIAGELEKAIVLSKENGEVPFYVNATAGTTVMGSYDPINAIADICEKHKLWLHVDACWGGGVAFSPGLRKGRLDGVERADSIAFNPHKMLGVPVTCSFLLGKDMRQFWKAMTLPAG